VNWFFHELGIDQSYFLDRPPASVAPHLLAIYGAKVSAKARNSEAPNLAFENREEDRAAFFNASYKGVKGSSVERKLDDDFLDKQDETWTLGRESRERREFLLREFLH
jgi:glutamate dehydrogenase